jgi:DNA mismatch repair ATPase MutS
MFFALAEVWERHIALINTCSTVQGMQTLRQWFLRPLASLSQLDTRHQSVETFSRPENRQSSDLFRQSLKRMKNVQYIYEKVNLGDPYEWACWGHLVDVSPVLKLKEKERRIN